MPLVGLGLILSWVVCMWGHLACHNLAEGHHKMQQVHCPGRSALVAGKMVAVLVVHRLVQCCGLAEFLLRAVGRYELGGGQHR